ncbi:hypothetical protein SEA_VANLEE_62 [Gordonia phage VanLee]|uniref:Uncharacterized protein n=1 Tax=Gordonia phage VanLee TaxID=2845816 RepID=A0A8F2DA77_9CAUD|nr:hypothetical protein QEH49_gp062 [Gordonia phage VanLee]QWS68179.1 hypothetical protein SEA_VANLEE_62 [Gordonia phage VanLee]
MSETTPRLWITNTVPQLPDLVAQAAGHVRDLDHDELLDHAEVLLRETIRLGAITTPTVEQLAELGGTHLMRSMVVAEVNRRLELEEFDAPVQPPTT